MPSFLDQYDAETETKQQKSSTEEGGESTENDLTDENEQLHHLTGPPLEYIDQAVKGYELVSFDGLVVPPPPDYEEAIISSDTNEDETKEELPPKAPPVITLACSENIISENECKAALIAYASQKCCYGSAAAKNMTILKMEYLPAFHYELQTFSEKRETAWTYSPLKSRTVLGGECGYSDVSGIGTPPLPWEIEEFPTQAFKDEVRLVPVPRTASIKSCHRCRGTGGIVCKDCSGKGWSRCIHCHGDGYLADGSGMRERCFYCQHSKHGHGHQDCSKCHTKGKVNCSICDGHGQIRCYIQLSITWKVKTGEHVVSSGESLPDDLIRDVSGQVAYEEEAHKIQPLNMEMSNCPTDDKNNQTNIKQCLGNASELLVKDHSNSNSDQKIVCQRHQIRIVPLTKVTYTWKGKSFHYFVYGYENKVFLSSKYPQNICWGCSVL